MMPPKSSLLSRMNIGQVLLIGLIFRLLAVFFSKGYAFHDDHFEMAELVQRWREGISFLWTGSNVHVFSLIYPGFLYLLFEACHAVGLHSPEQIMFVVRLVHALFSLLSIYYAYKLTLRITDQHDTSILVALSMAIFWIFPFMSVRNLREFVCIPFLLMGSYYIADPKFSFRSIFLAAFFFALAFSIRLQILFIPLGIGIFLLFQKEQLKKAIVFGIFSGVAFMLTQGLFDGVYYGNPFASIIEYMRFNSDKTNIEIQPQGPWYQYIGTVAGVVWGLPFLLLVAGYIYSAKMNTGVKMFFFGSLLFFAFHSYYSNKQERFILPFLPYFLMLGIIGFRDYYHYNLNKKWLRKTTRFITGWFIIFNAVALCVLSVTYTKRSRVEAMAYLRKKGDMTNIIMESENGSPRPPLFYLGKQINFYELRMSDSLPVANNYIPSSVNPSPNYIIMSGDNQLEKRLTRLKILYPTLRFETNATPSLIDNFAYRLNPKHNENETWHIYRID
ncbi:MAG TPA: glycosyltransferase family 39 protein [Chitinophagaceae bacterium]